MSICMSCGVDHSCAGIRRALSNAIKNGHFMAMAEVKEANQLELNEALRLAFPGPILPLDENGGTNSEGIARLVEAIKAVVRAFETEQSKSKSLAEENETIKKWSQAQHDADGEVIKSLEDQVRRMRDALEKMRLTSRQVEEALTHAEDKREHGGVSVYCHGCEWAAPILAAEVRRLRGGK